MPMPARPREGAKGQIDEITPVDAGEPEERADKQGLVKPVEPPARQQEPVEGRDQGPAREGRGICGPPPIEESCRPIPRDRDEGSDGLYFDADRPRPARPAGPAAPTRRRLPAIIPRRRRRPRGPRGGASWRRGVPRRSPARPQEGDEHHAERVDRGEEGARDARNPEPRAALAAITRPPAGSAPCCRNRRSRRAGRRATPRR